MTTPNIQAQAQTLAEALLSNLTKQANATQVEAANIVAEQQAAETPTPREGNTVTETLQQLILQGVANGAATIDMAQAAPATETGVAGAVNPQLAQPYPDGTAPVQQGLANPNEVEKVAAVQYLVGLGHTMDDAVSMVKSAEEHMAREAADLEKAAALHHLVNQGYSIDQAIGMVKAAEEQQAIQTIEMAKLAACQTLMANGFSMDEALVLVDHSATQIGL